MPELMISPTPTSPNAAGNANALSQSDATRRTGDGVKSNEDGGAESPFAAVLKSKIDQQASGTDASSKTAATGDPAQADAGNSATSPDLAALLPLLGVDPALAESTAMVAATMAPTEQRAAPDEKPLPTVLAEANPAPIQLFTALPMAAPATIDAGSRKQNVAATNEAFPPVVDAKPDTAGSTPGKIALEAAISADSGRQSSERSVQEAPASDFHALIERTTTMAPNATSQTNGSPASPALRVDTPLGQAGWHEEMGQKLTWMVGNNRQQADLVLTPPQLGRVEVSLTMNGDQATAIFTSTNPAVREALENSLHRLREVLAEAGVSLGQTQVGSQSPNQSPRDDAPSFGRKESVRYASAIPLQEGAAVARTTGGRSMIDIFA